MPEGANRQVEQDLPPGVMGYTTHLSEGTCKKEDNVHPTIRRGNDRDRLRATLCLRDEFVISSTAMNKQLMIRASGV
jgi:hypothetical protein